jgi:acyl-CoA dehydrogenase
MIADSINRLFEGEVTRNLLEAFESGTWPEALWQEVEQTGYADVLCGDDDEVEPNWRNSFPVFHAIGYYRAPLPLSETIIARALLKQAGLPPSDGPMSVIQQLENDGLTLELRNGQLHLHGSVAAVPWARYAKALVVAGQVGERRVLGIIAPTETPGLSIENCENAAREPRDTIHFENCICKASMDVTDSLPPTPVQTYGALARAVMMSGAIESVLRDSVQYANERSQFGRLIGKFQAIQQYLAVLAGETSCAQTASLAACESASSGPREFDVAVAKVRVGRAAGIAAGIAHQVHGAMGFTYEHTLHYGTRRLWSWRAEFGSESMWAKTLGRQAIARGGQNFWSDLTSSDHSARA